MARNLSSCSKQLLCLLFAALSFTFSHGQNPIVTENALTGNPSSEWDISGAGDLSLQGFATDISVNKGSSISFKINTATVFSYTIKVYRLGYYNGMGARLITTLGTFNGTVQPAPISDTSTGLVDCGNWSVSASYAVPSTAVSGYYIALLQKVGNPNVASHIVFIVRDDASTSDILFQASDATWQAYNNYGGNSLYIGATHFPNGHAAKVSYNRPFVTRNGGGGGDALEDFLFNSEYPMIRFMERNGYNITYFTNVDAARRGNLITNHKVFMSVGHDEYWSAEQRTNVEAARNAGVHLAFFSGNEVYWKTRWENSVDGSNTANRTLVCYKEGTLGEAVCGGKCDPTTTWTGLWRDGCAFTSGGGCKPENALTGQISWDGTTTALTVPVAYKNFRLWRNTTVAQLTGTQVETMTAGTLGYEWDWEQYGASNPSGRMTLSSTTSNGHTHKLSLYRHSSGALVFGAGTIQWSWGLDSLHDRGNAPTSRSMQQAMINLFADMNVQPATRMTRLVAATISTDNTAPTCVISSPANGASIAAGTTITISGTATDAGGGQVAGIEVSVDGGVTWAPATGTTSWTFSWTATTAGSTSIKVRGFDDSGRMSVPGGTAATGSITVTVTGSSSFTVFQTTDAAGSPLIADAAVTLGMKFRSTVSGFIKGVRYYKPTGATGVHVGTLWSSTGTKLAEATFSGETTSGWQQILFGAPVAITANTTYVISYYSPSGGYAAAESYFTAAVVNGQLRALADGEDGSNGLYVYGTSPTFPINSYNSSNYWADVVFTTTAPPDNTPPTVSSVSPAGASTGVSPTTAIVINFSEAVNSTTVTSTTVQLKIGSTIIAGSLVTAGPQVTLTPSAPLASNTTYTVVITGGSAGVKDPAGNALAANYTWTFTTGSVAANVFASTAGPTTAVVNEATGISLGMKFRVTSPGFITGVRYYKGTGTTGSHTGTLWSSTGTKLGEAVFINESASGWQQVSFGAPVAISANTTYIVSYHTPTGQYVETNPFFDDAVINGPLRGLANGEDGGNGLYIYSSTPAFPVSTYQTSNYWVDVVYATTSGPDVTPPVVASVSPGSGSIGAAINTMAVVTFNEPINASTVSAATFELRDGSNTLIPATITASGSQATLAPSSSLSYSSTYTVKIKGGSSGVKDAAGNALAADYTWTFTTADPAPPPAIDGPGGPILVISNTANPFSRYPVEMLRAQGLNEFAAKDITQVTAADLNNYDVVILGEMGITAAQATMFTNWTTAGGTFIAFKPSVQLSSLLGITPVAGSLSDKYLLVNTASGAGVGIVNQTIQFHGTADLYTLNGATALATLYSNATTATVNPAITSKAVGSNGGVAVAFTYDLAKSIIYTRQGNPAWSAQKRDGTAGPIRSDDMYNGEGAGDWVDFDKIAIPQADEQQHLLTNIIEKGNLHRKPLPKFWFLPSGYKAAVVMTGDDHGLNGTTGQFNYFKTKGPNTATDVADWKAIRGTSYIYNGTLTNAAASAFEADGFEIGSHINTNCQDVTPAALGDLFTNYLNFFAGNYPNVSKPVTNRIHCIAWSDWASAAKVEVANGIRFDVNYYYWPAAWVLNRPGMFTGSGMPMRFADVDGTIIDCYQAPTQMTDESQIDYTSFINTLLDKAQGPEGYYGVFTTNMHTDSATHSGAIAVVNSALAHNIPVVSAKQMLTWLDGRNNSYFSNMSWNGGQLTFSITALANARNLQTMVPASSANGGLLSITRNGSAVTYTTQTIKGIAYAFFPVTTGTAVYVATYNVPNSAPAVTTQPVVTLSTCAGSATSFTAAASGYPVPTVQWQVSTNGGTSWANITGATNVTYTFTSATTDNNKKYKAIFTNSQGTATTNVATLTVNAIPATPTISVSNQCGRSVLTAGGFTGSLLWSTGATTNAITVSAAGTYTLTQTINGCTSAVRSATAAPTSTFIPAPTVSVVNNCGTSVLTAGSVLGTLSWSTGATTTSITVPTAGTYTVTQTALGCSSPAASGIAAPKVVPATPTISTNVSPAICQGSSVILTASSTVGNTWSNGAATQSITVSAAGSFTVKSTVNGCVSANSAAQVVTVNPPPAGNISAGPATVCDNSVASAVFTSTAGTGPFSVVINGTSYDNITSGTAFNTNVAATTTSLWPNTIVPQIPLTNDGLPLEMGVKFRASETGFIKSIRFYKGSNNDGSAYTVKLYDNATQTLLGSQTFASTTATGWQTVALPSPIAVTAGTTYVASYYSSSGNYAYSPYYFFTGPTTNGSLTALADGTDGNNGVFFYGGSGFPSSSYQAANYWVDVVFVQSAVTLNLTSVTDANGCTTTGTLGSKTLAVNSCTTFTRSNADPAPVQATVSTEKSDVKPNLSISLGLDQNHPNPFVGTTTVDIHIPKTEKVRLTLYDVNGRMVRVILDEVKEVGSYSVPVRRNNLGAGVYYYRLEGGGETLTKKMTIF